MKDWDTMTVSKAGQSTLPKWWRDASGLSQGGVIEVRPLRDGKNSIILTPKSGVAPLGCCGNSRVASNRSAHPPATACRSSELPDRHRSAVEARTDAGSA